MEKQFYTIKELSDICNIPVRTLTYFEDIGLLKPSKKDEFGGYEYYSKEQIPLVSVIHQFKIQGFTLEELKGELSNPEFELQMDDLQRKKVEFRNVTNQMLQLEQRIRQYVDAMQYIDGDIHMEIKTLPAQRVAYVKKRGNITTEVLNTAFDELQEVLETYALRTCGNIMAITYDDGQDITSQESEVEICVPVQFPIEIEGIIHNMKEVKVLSAIHYGPYENEAETYAVMMQWILDNECQWVTQPIKRYIVDSHLSEHSEDYITELMIPIIEEA